jgi:hypothetical protein
MDDHQTIAVDMETALSTVSIDVDLETPLANVALETEVPEDMHDVQVSLTAALDFSSPSGTTAGLVIGIP